jgi:hypothetical protein
MRRLPVVITAALLAFAHTATADLKLTVLSPLRHYTYQPQLKADGTPSSIRVAQKFITNIDS